MSFFIGVPPFGLCTAFRLEPETGMAGMGAVRGARPILERFGEAMAGETSAEGSMRATEENEAGRQFLVPSF